MLVVVHALTFCPEQLCAQLMSLFSVMDDTVQVAVRARPFSQREVDLESPTVIEMRGKSTILFKTTSGVAIGETKDRSKEFVYDHSYWSVDPQDTHYISQEQVFSDLGKTVLESAFEGYNSCVFAYGQTGSGKTYTMMGTESAPGLIPRICQSLFSRIATGSLRKVSYKIEASYMEIYNERVRDLLRHGANRSPHNLRVREHPKSGPYVENLSRHVVSDYQAIRDLMNLGNSHRVTASTMMNDVSSRSHAIFTVTFTQATYSSDLPCETVSKINLVDLAGSERASATGAEGIRLKEGGSINKSLVCLGNVISALADMSSRSSPSKKPYIPYRDSVLTWLLKDSLGGNSKTIMVATVSPAESSYGETLSTLRYASRAKNIVNKPVVNEDPNVKLIRELRSEIRRLKGIITAGGLGSEEQFRDRANSVLMVADIQRKEEQIAELTRTWAGKWKDIQKMIEERNLALSSEGIKMTVASEHPHFVDILGTGVVIYHLKEGQTRIGSNSSSPKADIVLTAEDIQPEHCVVEYTDDQVALHACDGKCYVNHVEVTQQNKISHGDLVQLGDSTALLFNHPKESSRTGGSVLSPLAFSRRSVLEEQRSALERDYEERIKSIKEELEREKNKEKGQVKQELEEVNKWSLITGENDSDSDDNNPAHCQVYSDPYNVMRSVAFVPITPQSFSTREVIGEESNLDYHSTQGSDSPTKDLETQKNSNSVEECPVSEETSSTTPDEVSNTTALTQDPKSEQAALNLSFISGNLTMFDLDPTLSAVPPPSTPSQNTKCVRVPEAGTQPTMDASCQINNTEQETENEPDLRFIEAELEDAKGKLLMHEQEGKLAVEQLREAERKKAEAVRKSMDLEALCQQREEEQQQLHKQLQEMEVELKKRSLFDVLEAEPRKRSYAFGEKGRPRPQIRRRSRSARPHSARSVLKVEVPRYYLRGSGLNSYHIFEVKIQLGNHRWSVYRRYSEFQQFHEEVKENYPQLPLLTLPRSKLFGFKSEEFVQERRRDLECYLQSFVGVCMSVSGSPLSESAQSKLTKEKLGEFSSFFVSGSLQADVL